MVCVIHMVHHVIVGVLHLSLEEPQYNIGTCILVINPFFSFQDKSVQVVLKKWTGFVS